MKSPFPGMDPYLERPSLWPDVHSRLANAIGEQLGDRIGARYWVGLERRVYIEYEDRSGARVLVPDFAVAGTPPRRGAAAALSSAAPLVLEAPDLQPIEVREVYLVLRELPSMKIVTVLEILSPSNKQTGHGRDEYFTKRHEVLRTKTHLVELDLLREGLRVPVVGTLPTADYFAFVHRSESRPRAEVWSWGVRDAIPRIPVPLLPGDPDATLDLGDALAVAYQRGRYERVIDYAGPSEPPLPSEDASWASELRARQAPSV